MNFQEPPSFREPRFRERLAPSWPAFLAALIALPSFYLVFLPINQTVGLATGALVTLSFWVLMFFGAPIIEVVAGQLSVGKAHIPVDVLGEVREVEPAHRFAERGPNLDSRAHVRFQVGVKGLVRIQLQDDADPTPYWLISTRRPVELVDALRKQAN